MRSESLPLYFMCVGEVKERDVWVWVRKRGVSARKTVRECVCMCVRERQEEGVCVCECEREGERERERE